MLWWEAIELRRTLAVRFAAQVLVAAGFAIGLGALRAPSGPEARFLVGGTVAVSVVVYGLIIKPVPAVTRELPGSLPVPRSAGLVAWLTLTVLAGVPGAVAATVLAAWNYGLPVGLAGRVVPAIGLCAAVTVLAGYVLARAGGRSPVVSAAAPLLLLALIGTAPLAFPASRLPGWLDRAHDWFPLEAMALVGRAAADPERAGDAGPAYLTLVAWLAGLGLVATAVSGRWRWRS